MYHVSPNMHKLQQLHYPKSGPKKLPYPKFHFTMGYKAHLDHFGVYNFNCNCNAISSRDRDKPPEEGVSNGFRTAATAASRPSASGISWNCKLANSWETHRLGPKGHHVKHINYESIWKLSGSCINLLKHLKLGLFMSAIDQWSCDLCHVQPLHWLAMPSNFKVWGPCTIASSPHWCSH